MNKWSLIILSVMFASCAQLRPGLRVQTFGSADPENDEKIATRSATVKEIPNVQVVVGSIPEGLDVVEGGKKIVVKQGYESRYEILGTVEADYMKNAFSSYMKNAFWTWDYDEGWRKALCWPQAPLKALTIGIWNFVPTAWPCLKKAPSEESVRQKAMIDELKKGAAGMGGNLVFVRDGTDLQVTTIDTKYGFSSTNIIKDVAASAFVIKENK